MNKESLVNSQIDYTSIGEEITHELAGKMVKNHLDKHNEINSYSYFVGKDIIEQMLAQPGCVGIQFIDAINESGEKTLVSIGYDAKGKNIANFTTVNDHGKLAITPGMTGDKVLVTNPGAWWD